MSDPVASTNSVRLRGVEPSIIERFGIEGLYGYRSISLTSEYAATILIAKNGTGKTTLLGALDAFLRMQLSRLRNLEFSVIRCKLRGYDEDLVLSHNDVVEFLQVPTEGDLAKLASRSNVPPAALFSFIVDEWSDGDRYTSVLPTSGTFNSVVSAFNYSHREATNAINRARESIMERQPTVSNIFGKLKSVLNETEIVYLPTYRRVELALRGNPREAPYKRSKPKFDVATGSLFTGEIQFGLSDISDRLSELNQQIILESNSG